MPNIKKGKFINSFADISKGELSLLLAAFIGCTLEGVGCGEDARGPPRSAQHQHFRHSAPRVLRYLWLGSNGTRAREELEGLMKRAGGGPPSWALLLHLLYYVACSQCPPSVALAEGPGCGAHPFFEPPPHPGRGGGRVINASSSSCCSCGVPSHNVKLDPSLSSSSLRALHLRRLEGMRRRIACFFSGSWAHQDATMVLLFADSYIAWLARDYHRVVNTTEKLLQMLPRAGEYTSIMCVIRHVARFMHAFSIITLTNTSHPGSRDEIERRIKRVSDDFSDDNDDDDDDDEDDNNREYNNCNDLSWRPPLIRAVFNLIHEEIFDSNGSRSNCSNESLISAVSWESSFLLSLQAWLRTKRLTDEGAMIKSRDILFYTIERLHIGISSDITSNNVFFTVNLTTVSIYPFFTTTTNTTDATVTHESSSLCQKEGQNCVMVRLLPLFWLQQLFLVNCAALGDTKSVLYYMQLCQKPLTMMEILYLAVCPTLAAGGLHSNILTSFSVGDTEGIHTSIGLVETLQKFPVPVQIPLLSHRLWKLRREFLHNLPHSLGMEVTSDIDSISMQREILYLCEVLVNRVQGLLGSMELSFTDCAPHRVLFDAIIVACDVQENLLRDTAASLGCGPPPSVSRLQRSSSTNSVSGSCNETVNVVESIGEYEGEVDLYVDSAFTAVNSEPDCMLSCIPSVVSDGESDNDWLVVNSAIARELPLESNSVSSLSSSSVFDTSIPVTGQELYWQAHRAVVQWMSLLEENFPHLLLSVKVCQLRIAATAFDKMTPHLAQELMRVFRGNALADAHVAIALFANLHLVPSERCIREAIQKYPHSAELQRLYRVICGHENTSRRMRQYFSGDLQEEEERVQRKELKHSTIPMYIYRYRGILPVRYNIYRQRTSVPYIPLIVCLFCVVILVSSLALHVKDLNLKDNMGDITTSWSDRESSVITKEVLYLRWSFALPFSLTMYWGFGIIVYALIAAILVPYLAQWNHGMGNNISFNFARFIATLMEVNCLVDDTPNRLVFCLRGVSLLNLLTGVQLVASNTLRLFNDTDKKCNQSDVADSQEGCDRMYTEWDLISFFLIIFLVCVGVLFNGRAWRIMRYRDVMVGSLATFITIFFIDVVFFILYFPLLLICSVVLEPILFTVNIIFSTAASLFSTSSSLLLLLKHIPSVPGDDLLSPSEIVSDLRLWDTNKDFCVEGTWQLRELLIRNLQPVHWSPQRYHDFPFLCAHEVLQPPATAIDSNACPSKCYYIICNCGCYCNIVGRVGNLLQAVASRGIASCIALHRLLSWRAHHRPQQSLAAVQLALLRESWVAVFPAPPTPQSPNTNLSYTSAVNYRSGGDDGSAARSASPVPCKEIIMEPFG